MGICPTSEISVNNKVDINVPGNNEKESPNRDVNLDNINIKKNSDQPSDNSTEMYKKIKTYSNNINLNHKKILNPKANIKKSKLKEDKNDNNIINNKNIENKNKEDEKSIIEEEEDEEEKNKEKQIISKTQIVESFKVNILENTKSKFISEDKTLINIIKSHFLFDHLSEEEINKITNSISKRKLKKGTIIFNEEEEANNLYIIKKGTVKIFDKKKYIIISEEYSSFGEISLIPYITKRKYSAITESNVELYEINKNSYFDIIQNKINKESNKDIIFNYFLEKETIFYGISNEEKKNFLNLIRYQDIKNDKTKIQLKENFSNSFFPNENTKMFFVGKGRIQISIKQNNNNYLSYYISEGSNFGFSQFLFDKEKKKKITKEDYFIGYSKDNIILYLNEKIFIECFGINYKNYLLNSCALNYVKSDNILNTIKVNCNVPDDEIYKLFKIKKYIDNTLIFQKGISSNNSKSIIILEGKLSGFKLKEQKSINKYLFEGNNILTFKDFEEDFVTLKDTIIYETTIEQIQNYTKEKKLNSSYIIILYNILNKFQIFNRIKIEKAFDIIKHIHIKYYKQNHIIQKIGKAFKNIYLIENGTIAVYSKSNSLIKIIDTGNFIGGISILDEQSSKYNYIVYSKDIILYQIDKNYYLELLKEQSINDYIKYKMYLESDISLNDLYYLSYLGRGKFGNVCLVHNEIFFYAIKSISKCFVEQKFEIKYLFFEKNTLSLMDHPFILKLIKTLKNENWLFFLTEYIPGINMGEYLDSRKNKRNLFETKFYASLLFITINYIHKKKIIHRDIKPTNIMIDERGYIKLIDFGTAKLLNDNEKTKTIIGSPNFISPEVLLGKGYSFSCDYWSIGICIYYIYYGVLPFGNNSLEILDTYKEIIEKDISFSDNDNIELNSLLNTLLDKNENNRLSLYKMIKTHFFFKDIDFDALLSYKIKAPFIPLKDQRSNDDNLQNINSPFIHFIDNQKNDSKSTITLKSNISKKNFSLNLNNIPNNWFESF